MTGAIIPDDWDGVTWTDKRVTVPDSAKWLSIVRGNITLGQSPFFWDVDSGSVEDATNTAEEIENRSTDNNLFPADIIHVQDTKLFSRRFDSVIGTPPVAVPQTGTLLLGAAPSVEFPSTSLTMDFTALCALGATQPNVFFIRLLDVGTGTLYWRILVSISTGVNWVSLNYKKHWSSLHYVGFPLQPYLDISASNPGGTVYWYSGEASLHTWFDLTGDGINIAG